ncbi:cytochrome b/b6 domain-containing protein, partial [Escherichia coli]|uniref:cytochrome b/b6 domain-containing protein n=1 Tax=Escherichia coli TaxID=562 RepID=UPI000A6D9736
MQQKSDNVVSHYVFEAPVRIWHWLTVLCMAVLMVTGYFIGKPLPSVSGEATGNDSNLLIVFYVQIMPDD